MYAEKLKPGQKYNSLTVLEYLRESSRWLCACDCGNTTKVGATHIRTGKVKSCGCKQHTDNLHKLRCNNLGKTYGAYTVLARHSSGDYLSNCKCGNTLYLSLEQLGARKSQVCTCKELDLRNRTKKIREEITTKAIKLNKEGLNKSQIFETLKGQYDSDVVERIVRRLQEINQPKAQFINIGDKYNLLTVIGTTYIGNYHQWICKCECGNTTRVTGNALRKGAIKSCGCLHYNSNPHRQTRMLGNTYGPYTVLAKDSNGQFLCKCTCGTTILLDRSQFCSASKCKCKRYLSELS